MKNPLHFLQRDMVTATETTPVKDIAALMAERRIGAVPIMREEKVIGIVSERDIVRRFIYKGLSLEKTTSADIMTRDVTVVDIKDDPAKICNMLCNVPFRHLPILDGEKLIGMATEKDIRAGILTQDHTFRSVIFDQKFKYNKLQYFWQSSLAALTIFIVLLTFNVFTYAAIVASLGASTFIAFGMPRRASSKPRFLIGGYIVGLLVGLLFSFISSLSFIASLPLVESFGFAIFGALAVGFSTFVMTITDTEHPPAAGIALGLVLSDCDLRIIVLIIVGIVLLSGIKELMKPHLKDLL